MMTKVLVTGGTGFVAGHIIFQLLKSGYSVVTTVRQAKKEEDIKNTLYTAGLSDVSALSFAVASLESDDGWCEAMAGCDIVLHVASPFPSATPKNENDIIRPAVDGTLRILKAATATAVKRVVMTSSFAAVGYGYPSTRVPYTEDNWTNTNADISAYIKSKAIAEKSAWDFISQTKNAPEFCTINPVGIFGPTLNDHLSASLLLIKKMLDGEMKGCPRIYFGVVDVRDVARLHLIAMTHPQAVSQRFLATSGCCLSLHDVAMILKNKLGYAAVNVPADEIADELIIQAAAIDAEARQTVPNLGVIRNASSDKAITLLNWQPGTAEDAILASARSILDLCHTGAAK